MSHLKLPIEYTSKRQGQQQISQSRTTAQSDEKLVQPNCELSWSQLVHAEIIAVASTMRKNSRWSGMSVSSLNMGSLGMSMGLRGRSPMTDDVGYRNQESPLMAGFTNLRKQLASVSDLRELDAVSLLEPFLEVIRSGDTNGPITSTALSSVEKLLTYAIINKNSPNLPNAMLMLSSAATHCKFEASDSVSDEFVLLKILQVLRLALTSEVGQVLSDESLCEMMETGLSMCCQMRLSEMLRRSAEHTMVVMIQTMFQRLKDLSEDSEILPSSEDEGNSSAPSLDSQVRMAPPDPKSPHLPLSPANENEIPNLMTNLNNLSVSATEEVNDSEHLQIQENTEENAEHTSQSVTANDVSNQAQDAALPDVVDEEEDNEPRPFGLPSIRELLRVLISLLNPHDHQHTDTMRLMALSILNVAFEVGGRTMGRFESLRNLVVDDLCKSLFQLARRENIALLTLTLRTISTVFDTLRPHLKLQQELYLSFLIERLTPASALPSATFSADIPLMLDSNDSPHVSGTSTPLNTLRDKSIRGNSDATVATGEVRELLLESLGQLAREPTFMVDLWVNYDCDVDCSNLFEDVVAFLSRNSFPNPTLYSASNSHLLCLDALLMYVNHMVDRLQTEKNHKAASNSGLSWKELSASDYSLGLRPSVYPSPVELLERRKWKQILLEGAAKFNETPKAGLEFLEANGVIYDDPSVNRETSLASFLKSTPRLNKTVLGDFLSKPSNIEVLKAFVRLFDFKGKRIDEAMREMLESFRLPGEAQQIERIMETFATAYFASGPPEIATQDATFVLSYSVIMLNTDLHNPQVRRRMSLDDYMRNLRNVNGGQDFDPEYLRAIYDAIRKREIVMPEEHEGQLGFNYLWKELIHRTEAAGPLIICDVSLYDKDMFITTWKPIVTAISYAFTSAPDDMTLQKAITGFHQCALLSANCQLYDVFDYIIMTLAKMTGLLGQGYSYETANNPVVNVNDIDVTISDLSIQFGRNYKGQLAAVVLFAIANEYGNVLKDGWKFILEIIKNLFVNSLLPSSMSQVEDFLEGTTTIPLKPKSLPIRDERTRGNSSSLLFYLLENAGILESSRSEPTKEEIECTMCTVDCVAACRLEELFADIRLLQQESLEYLMRALKFIADGNSPSDSLNSRNSVSQELSNQNLHGNAPSKPYDPAAVFFLELMINVTLQNRDRVQSLWPILFEHIADILKDSTNHSILLVERTVVALLRLSIRLTHKEEMVSDVLRSFELLRALPTDIIHSVGEQMMAGVYNLIKADSSYIRGQASWETLFGLLRATSTHPQASKYSFDTLVLINESENVNSDNFNESVELLTEFASAAGILVEREGSPEKNAKTYLSTTQADILERAQKSVELLYQLYTEIPRLLSVSQTPMGEVWSTYWLPILTGLSQQCYNSCREVRQTAMTYLQRALLNPDLASYNLTEWVVIFDVVLFPLLDQLLEPEIFNRDPVGMDETRMRASALLCKIFLHYLNRLVEWRGLITLWLQILDVMERYMAIGDNDSLSEAIPESLKNMLLVMSTSGVLQCETNEKQEEPTNANMIAMKRELWNVTWEKINKFLPSLQKEFSVLH